MSWPPIIACASSAFAPRSGEKVAEGRMRGAPSPGASRHPLPRRGRGLSVVQVLQGNDRTARVSREAAERARIRHQAVRTGDPAVIGQAEVRQARPGNHRLVPQRRRVRASRRTEEARRADRGGAPEDPVRDGLLVQGSRRVRAHGSRRRVDVARTGVSVPQPFVTSRAPSGADTASPPT